MFSHLHDLKEDHLEWNNVSSCFLIQVNQRLTALRSNAVLKSDVGILSDVANVASHCARHFSLITNVSVKQHSHYEHSIIDAKLKWIAHI